MPLWKLQTVGGFPLEFLYENRRRGSYIELRPGVMFCLRRFHELVADLVRAAWVRYVRRFNGHVLGASSDLDQFLFGAERASLDKYLSILREVQEARCLYCEREVAHGSAHIDHFIPWARYPIDLGHNFVLAHGKCNTSKADHLAASVHLRRWIERNRTAGEYLQEQFDRGYITHNAETSERIARWAYSQAAAARGMAWLRRDEFQPINESYLSVFA
jgi:5-methylcytosine-specific restriction endonuclease McrA